METITLSIADRSLLIGGALLGAALLGGLFQFIKLGLFSVGIEGKQASIGSGLIMLVGVVFIYRSFLS